MKDSPSTNIRILDNLTVGTRNDLSLVVEYAENEAASIDSPPDGIELIVGDIRDSEICRACGVGVDVIVHLAANTGVAPSVKNPRLDMESNVLGTLNMLEAARSIGVERFIFASSGAPVGETEPPIHERKAPRPVSPYGASKLAGEGYCSAYYHTFGIKTVALRFGNVYGPLSIHKNSVVARFFKQALAGETLEIFGDGRQTRDFIFIEDLVQAIMLSSETHRGGEVFQIATHRETTVNEIAQKIGSIVERYTGKSVTIIHGESRIGDVRRNYSDITKSRKILGYWPRYDLDRGLEETFVYFVEKGA